MVDVFSILKRGQKIKEILFLLKQVELGLLLYLLHVLAVDLDAGSLDICQNFPKRQPVFFIKSPHSGHIFLFLDFIFLQKAL